MPPNKRAGTDTQALRVHGNDWSVLGPPQLGAWEPNRAVSVVVPAMGSPSRLDLVLAALAAQSYPAHLVEVLVVDDGSAPAVALPDIRPKDTRVVRTSTDVRGRAASWEAGVSASDGDVVCLLDRDVVVCSEFLEALLRWHHVLVEAVALGLPNEPAAGAIARLRSVSPTQLFEYTRTGSLGSVVELSQQAAPTGDLRTADHEAYLACAGSALAASRSVYREAGGVNPALQLGEDVELGYRLAQVGAVFIPEPSACGWRLDPSAPVDRDREAAVLADLMPLPRRLRAGNGRVWAVPLVQAVVLVRDESYEVVRGCVDRLLGADEEDLRVLIAAYESVDRSWLRTVYRSEPRVAFEQPSELGPLPVSVTTSPFLLVLPAHCGLGVSTVRALVEDANTYQSGLLRVVIPGVSPAVECVRLWRTAAVSRARRVIQPGETLEDAISGVAGLRWLDGYDLGVADLRTLPHDAVASPLRWRTEDVDLARSVSRLRQQVARLTQERDRLVGQRDAVARQRDKVIGERDTAITQRDRARAALTLRGVLRRDLGRLKARLERKPRSR
jgi:glycosyltransferase involved in cell wall biosynthesis